MVSQLSSFWLVHKMVSKSINPRWLTILHFLRVTTELQLLCVTYRTHVQSVNHTDHIRPTAIISLMCWRMLYRMLCPFLLLWRFIHIVHWLSGWLHTSGTHWHLLLSSCHWLRLHWSHTSVVTLTCQINFAIIASFGLKKFKNHIIISTLVT